MYCLNVDVLVIHKIKKKDHLILLWLQQQLKQIAIFFFNVKWEIQMQFLFNVM